MLSSIIALLSNIIAVLYKLNENKPSEETVLVWVSYVMFGIIFIPYYYDRMCTLYRDYMTAPAPAPVPPALLQSQTPA